MTSDSKLPTIHPSLTKWIASILGASSMESLAGQPLAAVVLAEAKGARLKDFAPSDQVLEAWREMVDAATRATLQANISFVAAARRAGWSDDRIAATMPIVEDSVEDWLSRSRTTLARTHPGFTQ